MPGSRRISETAGVAGSAMEIERKGLARVPCPVVSLPVPLT